MKNQHIKEAFRKEIVQRIIKNLLDIQILKIVSTEPMWGYKIKKQIEAVSGVRVRHGVLYPLLNKLEHEGFLTSQKLPHGKRLRKVYTATEKGKQYLETYYDVVKE